MIPDAKTYEILTLQGQENAQLDIQNHKPGGKQSTKEKRFNMFRYSMVSGLQSSQASEANRQGESTRMPKTGRPLSSFTYRLPPVSG